MTRRGPLALAFVVTLLASLAAGREGHAAKAGPPQVTGVTLLIRHRAFPDFFDVDSVGLKQDFQVGDTPYSARVVEFLPDFAINLKTRRVLSRTNEPNNPAFRIIVREKGVPQDTVWAFLNMPPHFARKSLLAFMVGRIDFKGRPPLLSGDSTASRVPRPQSARADSVASRTTRPPLAGKDSTISKAPRP
jgi:hypothetical protein